MRLTMLGLIILQMFYQSINGGDWGSLQSVLAKQDKTKALLFVKADPTLTELVEKHFDAMEAFDATRNKQAAMWLSSDLKLIHKQMKSHLS